MVIKVRLTLPLLAAFLFMGLIITPALSATDEAFNPAVIGEVWLDIPGSSWTPIDDEALTACEPHPRSYYQGAIKIGKANFPGSGLRIKGGCGSARTLEEKAAFKADLSWDDPAIPGCPPIRTHMGLKKFTLNNQVEDASFTHERIGYDFLQKLGIPVPRVVPMRVHVNDQLWGLYLHVETMDRRFLARHFDSIDGALYEADYGCDIGEESCFETKFDSDTCDDPPEHDPAAMTPLQRLNARLAQIQGDNFYPAINQVFDFDAFLRMWAAATVMGYWDGYPNDANNYRIYHDPTDDRWKFIPSGIDQLFENDVDPFNPTGLLSIRCLADADCKAAFRSKLAEVIDLFEASDYPAMARRIEKQIRADVTADSRKEVTVTEWHAAVNSTVAYMRRRPGELRALLSKPEEKKASRDFYLHQFTDPKGDRFIVVSWLASGDDTATGQRWLTAKGNFEGLTAKMDALEMRDGIKDGVKVGTATVNFASCETAEFSFSSDDDDLVAQSRTIHVAPGTWKYCK